MSYAKSPANRQDEKKYYIVLFLKIRGIVDALHEIRRLVPPTQANDSSIVEDERERHPGLDPGSEDKSHKKLDTGLRRHDG
jgi:hypothetical protein